MPVKNPSVSYKKTKLIVDIGSHQASYDPIKSLVGAGADGFRIDFCSTDCDLIVKQVKWIRKASKELNRNVAIVQVLQGPDLFIGEIKGVIPVQQGQQIRLRHNADYARESVIPLGYDFSKHVKRGERIYLFNLKLNVSSVADKIIHARAEDDGIIIAGQRIALPDTDFSGDVITKKDRQDLVFGQANDFDYIELGLTQTASDVLTAKRLLKNLNSTAKVIARIESGVAIKNVEDIISEADAAMFSSDYLSCEVDDNDTPFLPFKLIELGRRFAKPILAATHELAGMTHNSWPNRLEAVNLATKAAVGFDAIVLDEATIGGKHPVTVLKRATDIIVNSHKYTYSNIINDKYDRCVDKRQIIPEAIIKLANQAKAAAIIAQTKSGAAALAIAALRPRQQIVAVANNQRVAQQLAIVYGAQAMWHDTKYPLTDLTVALRRQKILQVGDLVILAAGKQPGVIGSADTIEIKVVE